MFPSVANRYPFRYYGASMPEPRSNPVPIRFGATTRSRLHAVSENSGLSVSDVCRLAVEQFLTETERTGKITLTLSSGGADSKKTAKARAQPKRKAKKKA